MAKIFTILMAVLVLQAGTALAQDKVTQPTAAELKAMLADFDQYAAKAMTDWKIPGMAGGQHGVVIPRLRHGWEAEGRRN